MNITEGGVCQSVCHPAIQALHQSISHYIRQPVCQSPVSLSIFPTINVSADQSLLIRLSVTSSASIRIYKFVSLLVYCQPVTVLIPSSGLSVTTSVNETLAHNPSVTPSATQSIRQSPVSLSVCPSRLPVIMSACKPLITLSASQRISQRQDTQHSQAMKTTASHHVASHFVRSSPLLNPFPLSQQIFPNTAEDIVHGL